MLDPPLQLLANKQRFTVVEVCQFVQTSVRQIMSSQPSPFTFPLNTRMLFSNLIDDSYLKLFFFFFVFETKILAKNLRRIAFCKCYQVREKKTHNLS